MIRFNNDYNHGAHPEILEALGAINGNSYGGYGEDEWCEKAAELIREKIHCADAAVHFFPEMTGSQLFRYHTYHQPRQVLRLGAAVMSSPYRT